MLEPTALRYFREVALVGSVTVAGANLFVAPSAVSRQVRNLEEHLGVQLFSRGSRGMSLTAAGHQLLDFAQGNAQRGDDLRAELDAARFSVRGIVVIATIEGMLTTLVPETLERLDIAFPDVRVDVHVAGSLDVGAMVAEGGAHLGFLFGSPARSDLIVLQALPLPLSVVVRADNPLACQAACAMRDLDGSRVALPGSEFGIRQEIDRALAEAGVRLKVVSETNSLALLRQITVRTGAVTFMAARDCRPEVLTGDLVDIPMTDQRLSSTQVTFVKGLIDHQTTASRIVADAFMSQMGRDGAAR